MRTAFEIKTITATKATIAFFDARNLSDEPNAQPLIVGWQRAEKGKPWEKAPTVVAHLCEDHGRILAALGRRLEEAKATSPLHLIRAVQYRHGVQVVWDATAKKYRNVGLLKDGATIYELVGTDLTIEFSGDHEEKAVANRAKRTVADAMVENPEKAADLSKWFAGGCKTKKVSHHKAPNAVPISELAQDKDEEALAATPVRKAVDETDE